MWLRAVLIVLVLIVVCSLVLQVAWCLWRKHRRSRIALGQQEDDGQGDLDRGDNSPDGDEEGVDMTDQI